MTRVSAVPVVVGFGAVLGAWAGEAHAQVEREPLGPLECFAIADAEGLASTSALELCAGAFSSAPGQCFALADDQNVLTTAQSVDLCANATSTAPIACFAQLQAEGTLTNQQMLEYCGTRCPLGPAPPEVSSATCLSATLEATNLAQQMAEQLCLGSQSTAPVECFLAGADTWLTEAQLVDLCAEAPSCQYANAGTSSAY